MTVDFVTGRLDTPRSWSHKSGCPVLSAAGDPQCTCHRDTVVLASEPGFLRVAVDGLKDLPEGLRCIVFVKNEQGEYVEWKPSYAEAAIRTLISNGFTYHGGEQWKPPLGGGV